MGQKGEVVWNYYSCKIKVDAHNDMNIVGQTGKSRLFSCGGKGWKREGNRQNPVASFFGEKYGRQYNKGAPHRWSTVEIIKMTTRNLDLNYNNIKPSSAPAQKTPHTQGRKLTQNKTPKDPQNLPRGQKGGEGGVRDFKRIFIQLSL